VPDSVLEHADEVELVDLPPDELIQRLREGKVYVPDQAALAIEQFFRKGNLIALRELALRRTAERVDAQMRGYMAGGRHPGDLARLRTRPVCVGKGTGFCPADPRDAPDRRRLGAPGRRSTSSRPGGPQAPKRGRS